MEYNDVHIGAVVGQLAIIHGQWINGEITEKIYRNVSTYTLSNWTGLSRYHLAAILRRAYERGYIDYRIVEHRPNVRKAVYNITRKGYDYLQELKDSGKYRSSLNLIINNRALQAKKRYAQDLADDFGTQLELIMMNTLKGKK